MFAAIPATTVPLTGCQAFGQIEDTPRGRYFQAQEVFILAVTNAIQAKQAGSIAQEDWDSLFNPAIQEGNVLLDVMESAYMSGDSQSFDLARASLESISRLLKGDE
jgi:hypothetical protein